MNTIRRFLQLAAPFWWRGQSWFNWLLLAAVIACALAIVRVSVWITEWNKTFYDALAAFDGRMMPTLIAEFLAYIALITACVACGNWLRKKLLFRWREHLTREFEQNWLAHPKHYRLQLSGEPDNPDQRIAEDIYLLSEQSIDLCKYFIMNAAKLGAFVAVLWQMSGEQHFVLFGQSFAVKGYLVWVALIYSAVCTLLMHLIGRKLQALNVERQHREADYRATLLRVRDHAEQIAFYRGETAEQGRLNMRFGRIKQNWNSLIRREFFVESFSAAYLRLSMFIPIIATLPMYLAKTMTFGDMMQARSAFGNVQDGFGWFMDYYKRIIEWAAVVERLSGFQTDLSQQQTLPEVGVSDNQALLVLKGLIVHTQSGRMLLEGVGFQAEAGERLLLDGKSGIGKSTLLRVLAGLWPYYRGTFALGGRALFLPQKPYLPTDSLRAVISYPNPPETDDGKIQTALNRVGLGRLKNDLDTPQQWHAILSGGEQQRLSLARVLLNPPQILFLDEATNQLDDASALALMAVLQHELPQLLCIAVSHQESVQAVFGRRICLDVFQDGDGTM